MAMLHPIKSQLAHEELLTSELTHDLRKANFNLDLARMDLANC